MGLIRAAGEQWPPASVSRAVVPFMPPRSFSPPWSPLVEEAQLSLRVASPITFSRAPTVSGHFSAGTLLARLALRGCGVFFFSCIVWADRLYSAPLVIGRQGSRAGR